MPENTFDALQQRACQQCFSEQPSWSPGKNIFRAGEKCSILEHSRKDFPMHRSADFVKNGEKKHLGSSSAAGANEVCGVYVREGDLWCLDMVGNRETAELARDVYEGLGYRTVIVRKRIHFPQRLES